MTVREILENLLWEKDNEHIDTLREYHKNNIDRAIAQLREVVEGMKVEITAMTSERGIVHNQALNDVLKKLEE